MALIPIEEEDDEDDLELEEDELEIEALDDGDDLSEPGENMNWPTAIAYVAFFLTFALVWHDCFGHR